MKKLLTAAVLPLLLALVLPTLADDEEFPLNPFVDAYQVDYALVRYLHIERKFPDSTFDAVYLRPTRAQLEELLTFYRLKRDLTQWVEEASDCDDIGREFMHVSHVWLRRTFPELHASIAVGMVYVEIDGDYGPLAPSAAGEDTKGLHVLNLVWLADGSWVFVEPQTGCIAPIESLLYEGVIYVFRVDM
jgi:hypothetical protein